MDYEPFDHSDEDVETSSGRKAGASVVIGVLCAGAAGLGWYPSTSLTVTGWVLGIGLVLGGIVTWVRHRSHG